MIKSLRTVTFHLVHVLVAPQGLLQTSVSLEHEAPDAHHEAEQTVGIVVVEAAEQDNAGSIGGKHDAE